MPQVVLLKQKKELIERQHFFVDCGAMQSVTSCVASL